MVGLRQYLPESRTSDAAVLERVAGPEDLRWDRTKPDIA